MVAHLSAFAGHIFPFAHIIAPLVVWLVRRETSAFVDDQGKEAINAQITFTIYSAVAVVLCFVFIGIPLLSDCTLRTSSCHRGGHRGPR